MNILFAQEDCDLRQPRPIGLVNVASLGLVWMFGIIFALLSFTIETISHHHHRVRKSYTSENDKYGTHCNIVDTSKLDPDMTLSNQNTNRKKVEENLEQLLNDICFDKFDNT